MIKLPKIVVILGATASGKTALGLALAKKFDGEVVSADSRQVYKYLDILSFFGVAALRHQNLDYSKLIPVIPILRAFSIDEAEKEEIKKEQKVVK